MRTTLSPYRKNREHRWTHRTYLQLSISKVWAQTSRHRAGWCRSDCNDWAVSKRTSNCDPWRLCRVCRLTNSCIVCRDIDKRLKFYCDGIVLTLVSDDTFVSPFDQLMGVENGHTSPGLPTRDLASPDRLLSERRRLRARPHPLHGSQTLPSALAD